MHFYHSYAVRDRVSITGLSDTTPNLRNTSLISIPVDQVLPTASDEQTMKHNFSLLISRILVDHLKHFSEGYHDVTERHIKHCFYDEMSMKSVIVSF